MQDSKPTPESQPVYIAMKPMRMKFPDGTYHEVAPGDPISTETVNAWPNPYLWWKRGWFKRADGKNFDRGIHGPYQPPRAVTTEDILRVLEAPEQSQAPSFPHASPDDIGPGKEMPSAVYDPSDRELDQEPKAAAPIDPAVLEDLRRKRRSELVRMADSFEIRINDAMGKEELIQKLLQHAS